MLAVGPGETAAADVLLDQEAIVYDPDGTGAHTVARAARMPCRLSYPGTAGVSIEVRAALAYLRVLYAHRTYPPEQNTQLVIEGRRWQVVAQTIVPLRVQQNAVMVWRCDVTEVLN